MLLLDCDDDEDVVDADEITDEDELGRSRFNGETTSDDLVK